MTANSLSIRSKEGSNPTITICRIVGMLMIIFTHLCDQMGSSLTEVFTVGNSLFFLMSGILYSNKEINNPLEWVIKRIIRIFLPLYCWIVTRFILTIVAGVSPLSAYETILNLLNLQGISKLLMFLPESRGPWFFTMIMVCYLLVLPIKKVEKIYINQKTKHRILVAVALVMLYIILFFANINIVWILIYFTGYFIGKKNLLEKITPKESFLIIFAGIVSGVIRVLYNHIFGNGWFYDAVIIRLSQLLLALSIVFFINYIFILWKDGKRFVNNSWIIRTLDSISVYVYICHAWLINGNLSLLKLNMPLYSKIVLIVFCSIIFASLLYFIWEALIGKYVRKRMSN